MKKGIGIRTRLWLIIVGVTLLVAAFIYIGQIFLLGAYYKVSKKASVKNVAEEIEESIKKSDLTSSGDAIAKLAMDNNLCIEICAADGATIKTADMMGSGCVIHSMENKTLNEIKNELLKTDENGKYYNISHPKYNKQSILYGKVVIKEGSTYFILINAYLEPFPGTTAILRSQLLTTIILVFLLSTIISFAVSQTFTRPIRNLKKAANEVARGNFSTRVEVERSDELGDLTETFNYMTAEVSKVEVLQKDLIANVSHEIRIPLTMIRGYAETIRDISGDDKEKRDRQLQIIIEETNRLNALVNDILSLGRIESGQERPEYEEFPIKELLEGLKQKYEMLYDDYTFVLQGDYSGTVKADIGKITQVLMNLINNAMNHSGEEQKITVALKDEGDKVRVSVRDTGSGIPKEELSLIWDRYYKSDRSGKRRVAGTGLGLSIVKAIMIAHKMPFGVNSKIGEGSEFWICLKK